MRRPLTIPTLALVVLLALAAAALSGGHASASEDEPTILLSSITVEITVDGPVNGPQGKEPLPSSIRLGYGMADPKRFDPETDDVVFFGLAISPSPLSRTFVADVAIDPKARALADDLAAAPEPTRRLFFAYRVTQGLTSGLGSPQLVLHIPPGAHIDEFKMTVAPFTIEKRIVNPLNLGAEPEAGGSIRPRVTIAPYSVYRMITDGPVATIEAWGPPPPGDANCDAAINSLDALVMLQHGAGLLDTLSCAKAADVNGDGTVDARDVQLVLQFTAGLIGAL